MKAKRITKLTASAMIAAKHGNTYVMTENGPAPKGYYLRSSNRDKTFVAVKTWREAVTVLCGE